MSHIKEHCKTPTARFRRIGSVWACECKRLYRVVKIYGYQMNWKEWQELK